MADPEPERADAYASLVDTVYSVLILCPCGQQLEYQSGWWFRLECPSCRALYEFGIPLTWRIRLGDSRRFRVRVQRE
jgi:hypothetical protein